VVTDLKQLLHENLAGAPADHVDVAALVAAGRRRRRSRRTVRAGGAALLVAAIVATAAVGWSGGADRADPADRRPAPDAPTLHLADAGRGVEGRDYRVLASQTNENLDRDNGQYLDGVTADGMVLFRDGPRADLLTARLALLDPATGRKDWLPELEIGQTQTWPLELGADRLVLLGAGGASQVDLYAYVFDRGTRRWSGMKWRDLPAVTVPLATLGPDDRLYVMVPATQGRPPEGGWPVGADGEADDADAEGDTYHLWSASLTDTDDVRDEQLTVGDVAFTDTSMVWTDSTNGDPGLVHVRDLSSGEEHSFDPDAGERCNLLSFGATGDRVVLGEYCGTYAGEVRDDRVQVLSLDGDQVVTLQDSGLDGALAGFDGTSDVVTVTSHEGAQAGTYVYDLGSDRFLRLTDRVSKFGLGGPVPGSDVMWHTPVNSRRGATQWVGQLLR
jgi:hypothetical protein